MVYNDLMTNPLLVPVKILNAHRVVHLGGVGAELGTLDCIFHPHQPWIFSSGADHVIRLFT
jgi:ribosome biogenesis protein ERB1